jgi:monomeric isocitrate dehydrogenase
METDRLQSSRWGEPTLQVRDTGNQTFSFQLRSRVNVPLIVGGPVFIAGELEVAAQTLLKLCSQENALRADRVGEGYALSVIDHEQKVLGQSEVMPTEAFAKAMKRLIAIQAQRARILLVPAVLV